MGARRSSRRLARRRRCTSRSTSLAIPGLVLLLRRRASGTLATLWADGWVASLGVASAAAYFFVEPALEGSRDGSLLELLVNLAYPIGDTLLLALVVGAIVATRGRMRRSWAAMCAALVAMAVSDGIYLNLSWSGSYADGSLLEAGWVIAALCLAWSLWLTYAEPSERRMTTDRAPIVWPVLWGGGVARPRRGARYRRRWPPDLDRARRRRRPVRLRSAHAHRRAEPAPRARGQPAGAHRSGDRPWQPPRAHRRPADAPRDDAARAPRAARAVRPQRLQGLQRPLRPPCGRRPPRASRHPAARRRRAGRPRVPDGRRRVLRPRGRRRRRGAGAAAHARASRADGARRGLHGQRGRRARHRGARDDDGVLGRCAPPTSACTRPSAARGARRCSRRPTCSPPPPGSASRGSPSTTTASRGSPSAPRGSSAWTRSASRTSAMQRGCTTSASSPCRRRSWRSRARSTPPS